MNKLSHIFWVGPKCCHRYLYKRKAGDTHKRRKLYEDRSRDRSDVAASRGMLAATRS